MTPTVNLEFEETVINGEQMLGVTIRYTDGVTPGHMLMAAASIIAEVAKAVEGNGDDEFADGLKAVNVRLQEVTATRELTSDQMF